MHIIRPFAHDTFRVDFSQFKVIRSDIAVIYCIPGYFHGDLIFAFFATQM